MKLGYSRLSSEVQTGGLSLEAQKEILDRAGCDRIYTDVESGWTGRGGESSDRTEFQKLLADARKLRKDGWPVEIIFPEFSRWARSTITSMGLIEELEEIGITLRSMDIGVVSVATAGQWLNTMQQSMVAEFYSRNLSDKGKRMYELKRATGKPLQHKPPLGWKLSKDRKKLEPNHEPYEGSDFTHWELGRKLVEMYLEWGSFSAIERWGWENGLRLHAAVVRKWMINPINQGHTWWYKQPIKKGQWRNSSNNEKEIIYNTHEPLITPGEMVQIEQKMNDASQNRGFIMKHGPCTLQGLVFCSSCGRSMKRTGNPTTKRKNYAYVRCYHQGCDIKTGKSYPYDKVEQALIEAIVARANDAARLATNSTEDEPKSVELIKLESDRDELLEMLERRESAGLRHALDELNTQIARFSEPQPVNLDKMSDMIEAISDPEMFDNLTRDEKRTIFVTLCEKIVVDLSGKMKDRKITKIALKF